MCPLRVHVRKSHIKQWWFDVHGAAHVTPQKNLLRHTKKYATYHTSPKTTRCSLTCCRAVESRLRDELHLARGRRRRRRRRGGRRTTTGVTTVTLLRRVHDISTQCTKHQQRTHLVCRTNQTSRLAVVEPAAGHGHDRTVVVFSE